MTSYKSWSFRGHRIQWNFHGQTAWVISFGDTKIPAHPEDRDGVRSRNVGKSSQLDAALCLRKFQWMTMSVSVNDGEIFGSLISCLLRENSHPPTWPYAHQSPQFVTLTHYAHRRTHTHTHTHTHTQPVRNTFLFQIFRHMLNVVWCGPFLWYAVPIWYTWLADPDKRHCSRLVCLTTMLVSQNVKLIIVHYSPCLFDFT